MVAVAIAGAAAMFGIAAVLTAARAMIGPSSLDRIVALKALLTLSISAVVLYAAWAKDGDAIRIALLLALTMFVAATVIAFHQSRRKPRSSRRSHHDRERSGSD